MCGRGGKSHVRPFRPIGAGRPLLSSEYWIFHDAFSPCAIVDAHDGVFRCAPLPSSNLVLFGRVAARERQGALSRRAW